MVSSEAQSNRAAMLGGGAGLPGFLMPTLVLPVRCLSFMLTSELFDAVFQIIEVYLLVTEVSGPDRAMI